jgi:uridine kinase
MTSQCPIRRIVKRNGTTVDYSRSRISTAILKTMTSMRRPDPELAARMAAKVEAALVQTYGAEKLPSVEDIQDVVETVLMENGLSRVAREYIIYRHQHAMARAARAYDFEVKDNVPYKKLYESLLWNMDHDCGSVQALNRLIASGRFPDLVREGDRRYEQEVDLAARQILGRADSVRLVIVAGPSSSGKTTTTIKLSERLKTAGVSFKSLNVDNYFFDLERHPKDEFGDYDYETPQALDLELIDAHVSKLLAGHAVRTPRYDFRRGLRVLDVHEMSLGEREILLIDSLHGLCERMTPGVPARHKVRLYIEALGQFKAADGTMMRWADNRLLRRMVRDRAFRNLQPIETLTHWHYVRRSELTNIIPFIKNTDCIVNSALPYELPVLKQAVFRCVSAAKRRYGNDPKRLDAHIRANRVHDLLQPLRGVRDTSPVPADSLLREFIGGSAYTY